jgi:hypothetical protein
VIAVASVAFVLLGAPLLKKGRNPTKPLRPVTAVEASPVKTVSKGDLLGPTIKLGSIKDDKFYERLSRVALALPLDRDPFSFAYAGPKSSREGLELVGILRQGEKPTAIINQNFLGVGDATDQFNVVSIQQDRVVLRDRTGEFELRLKQ